MTDAWLMDADCIHGEVWYECAECMNPGPDIDVKPCGCGRCTDEAMKDKPLLEQLCRIMILCPMCGNKRCPHAAYHEYECTGSNEPGQLGSNYP